MLPPSNNTCPWKLDMSLIHSSNTISCKLSRDMKRWNCRSLCSITLCCLKLIVHPVEGFTRAFSLLRASPECSVCDPAQILLTSKFSYLLSFNLGLQIGARLLIANHLDQSETGSSSQIIFITLFSCTCTALMCLLPASANCAKLLGNNHFAEPNWHVLAFLHPILLCRVTH